MNYYFVYKYDNNWFGAVVSRTHVEKAVKEKRKLLFAYHDHNKGVLLIKKDNKANEFGFRTERRAKQVLLKRFPDAKWVNKTRPVDLRYEDLKKLIRKKKHAKANGG